MNVRHKDGFRPPRTGRRTDVVLLDANRKPSLAKRIASLFDPTVTMNTIINEGVVFFLLAFW